MGFLDKLFGGENFQNQLTDQSVKSLLRDVYKMQTEIVYILEPGTRVWTGYEQLIPDILIEFNRDIRLGILHGQGRGHAFIRLEYLKMVFGEYSREIHDYVSLVSAFRKKGATVKRVDYIGFD